MTKYPYSKADGKIKWVSTEWLDENINEDLMIIDTQPNVHDYIKEHIQGALYLNEGLFRETLGNAPAMYIPAEAVQSIFSRQGIRKDVPTVVYTGVGPVKGWGDGLEQTMVAYSLVRFGHDNVYVLDGGIEKWKNEGRDLTQVFPTAQESSFKSEVRDDYYIEYGEFKTIKDDDNVVVLDARPGPVYEGQGPWIKPGHIPGAVNLPWASLMNKDNTRLLKDQEEIKSIVEDKGATPDKTIICSCGTGREATNEFILFKWFLGYPKVRIYEGSFTEWTQRDDNPTVTGPNPY
ncbi:MAG: sulfurtransferase [Methanomicrobiales archaeon]